MQKINLIKISLDIVMVVVFVLLFNTSVIAGLTFHEIAGLSIGFAFILHMAINRRWIKQVTRNLFGKQIAMKTRIGYWVDVLLLLSMFYTICSGIMISRVLFPNLQIGNESLFRNTHAAVAYLSLGLVGIHIGLHWRWVINLFQRVLRIKPGRKALAYAARTAAILIFAMGVYCIYTTNYFSKVAMIGTAFSQSQGFEHAAQPDLQLGSSRQGTDSSQLVGQEMNFGSGSNGSFEGGSNSYRQRGGAKTGLPDSARGGNASGSGILNTLASYLGVISVFSMITYYLEKLLIRKRVQVKELPAEKSITR